MNNFLMEITDVSKSYPIVGGKLRQVLSNVSFSIRTGEIIGLMGPSGSGKSTLARIILGLERPDSGSIQVLGKDISHLSRSQKKEHFRQVQMVWQDPGAYLNPYQSVFTSITEPLLAFDIGTKKQRRERVKALMRMLGLSLLLGERKPGQLSGGQCQRVAIARAIAISPKLLICDEALVNLDLPQQVEILKLLKRLKKQLQLTILFISHDKDTVNALCSRTLIMKKGGVV